MEKRVTPVIVHWDVKIVPGMQEEILDIAMEQCADKGFGTYREDAMRTLGLYFYAYDALLPRDSLFEQWDFLSRIAEQELVQTPSLVVAHHVELVIWGHIGGEDRPFLHRGAQALSAVMLGGTEIKRRRG